jgi:hypothetical protein
MQPGRRREPGDFASADHDGLADAVAWRQAWPRADESAPENLSGSATEMARERLGAPVLVRGRKQPSAILRGFLRASSRRARQPGTNALREIHDMAPRRSPTTSALRKPSEQPTALSPRECLYSMDRTNIALPRVLGTSGFSQARALFCAVSSRLRRQSQRCRTRGHRASTFCTRWLAALRPLSGAFRRWCQRKP